MSELKELQYECERLERTKTNFEKNYERRKKLNLLDTEYERQINYDIKKCELEIAAMKRKMRSIESEEVRKKMINK